LGKINTAHLRTATTLNRAGIYERTIFTEWLVLILVVIGVRLHGSSLSAVFGDRWRSVRPVFLDIGLALAFLVVSTAVLSVFGMHSKSPDAGMAFLLPRGLFEKSLWVLLSLTAGICEEALFRGYLQRQFMALTKSVALGIALSAVAFGLAHLYQGWFLALRIGALGAMLGTLAYWRKSVRPGMISHAAQDLLAMFMPH
jgi:hypothetical protein